MPQKPALYVVTDAGDGKWEAAKSEGGEVYSAIFAGPMAKDYAAVYANFRNAGQPPVEPPGGGN